MTAKLTLDELDRFLSIEAPSVSLKNYLCAAAVLSAFDPFTLNPVGVKMSSDSREKVLSELLPKCEPVNQATDLGLWTLSLPHRREGLQMLGSREEIKKALDANPKRQNTVLQRMFERVIEGPVLQLDQLSREELAAILEVLEWVEGIIDGLPQQRDVSSALARADLISPMERLAGRNFVGREEELEQLRDYVFGPKRDAPLFVFGTGGVGKSTLLARFLLAHAIPQNVAIAYVDVDRSTIRPDQPLTVLLDFVTQLHPQLGVDPSMADPIIKEIIFFMSRQEEGRHFESLGPNDIPQKLLDLVAHNLKKWLKARSALLVVDTVEEAQFLGPDVIESFIKMILALNKSMNDTRVILSGRALPEEYMDQAFELSSERGGVEDASFLARIPLPLRPLNLTELTHEPARELLRSTVDQTASGNLSDDDLNDVIAIVGRNPMCLKLAGRLLADEGVEKLRSERSEVFAKLKAEKIQALLYGRILRHLHDDEVRKVAYPGLIVRRIDADVIRDVLAGPCKLQLEPGRDADDIFDQLSREQALMSTDPIDGSLRHRADVRRSMLEDLSDHIEPEIIEEIDTNAVRFYSQRTGPVARAEEIYHRLRLKEDESVLESRWIPEASSYLLGALDELAPQQRLWLAEHLNVSLDASVRKAASQDAWENQAARSADRYLRARSPEQALRVLQERKDRLPRSRSTRWRPRRTG